VTECLVFCVSGGGLYWNFKPPPTLNSRSQSTALSRSQLGAAYGLLAIGDSVLCPVYIVDYLLPA